MLQVPMNKLHIIWYPSFDKRIWYPYHFSSLSHCSRLVHAKKPKEKTTKRTLQVPQLLKKKKKKKLIFCVTGICVQLPVAVQWLLGLLSSKLVDDKF
jgi:hypothetical protein